MSQTSDLQYTHTYTGQCLGGDHNNPNLDVKAVKINTTITTIQQKAFEYCHNLTTINIPNNITSIQAYAFSHCKNLTSIIIPSSVITIGKAAFAFCSNLESVHIISESTTQLEQFAFWNCPKLNDQSKQKIYKFYNQKSTTLLHNTFQNGPGPTLNFQGSTQKGYGPEMWGITLQQIQRIACHPDINPWSSMRDVVEIVIKPATEGLGIGYALLVNQDKPLPAKVMVSVSTV